MSVHSKHEDNQIVGVVGSPSSVAGVQCNPSQVTTCLQLVLQIRRGDGPVSQANRNDAIFDFTLLQ